LPLFVRGIDLIERCPSSKILREIEDIQSGKKDHELMDMMKQIKKTPGFSEKDKDGADAMDVDSATALKPLLPEVKTEHSEEEDDDDRPLVRPIFKVERQESSEVLSFDGEKAESDRPERKPIGRPRKDKTKEELPKEPTRKTARVRSRGGSVDMDDHEEEPDSPGLDASLSPSKKAEKDKKAWLKNVMSVFNNVSSHK